MVYYEIPAMKLAILHNYLNNIGGAEKVSLTLARELNADLYSPIADQAMIKKMGFTIPVHTLGWIPTNPPWRQQAAWWRCRQFKLPTQYDHLLITGDWAISAAHTNHSTTWYCHSPSRELWDLYDYTRHSIVPPLSRPAFTVWAALNRRLQRRAVSSLTHVIASSKNAHQRLQHYFHRPAPVVYPPVDTTQYRYKENGPFWLAVNRLVSYKRIALQLDVFRQRPEERLILVGSYEAARHFRRHLTQIKQALPANVTFLHHISDEQLRTLYARCKGLIATSSGEDFGLTTVEAMASGKPVIAVNEGGFQETVQSPDTGELIPATPEALNDAISRVGRSPARYREACQIHAHRFDTATCVAALKQHLYV